ncbi:MAG: protein-L-isoaspartate O-methyltransferase [Pseudomonadota bacterium]|nr:protein-L-isoaspartate O-methyltransferase [Pseudomonadota bacterium]QKK04203.1 MAG: protein-L-isoaspartate O-methyltransferase [Pseudomonadota bacterium]
MSLAVDKFSTARKNMVDCQIRPSKVTNEAVINAFETVPREYFVPSYLQGIAYIDEDIKLGKAGWLMEPVILARLLQAAAIRQDDVVLDIGCGSGYSTAVLAQLAMTVIGVDQDADMIEQADVQLQTMDVCNAALVHGNPRDGYQAQAPFNVILINGSVPGVPGHITDQLAEGGRLVTVLRGPEYGTGQAVLVTKTKAVITTEYLFDASTYPAPGFEDQAFFTF